ncbi:S8 family serine peptidase [bacterium]|nr:S8 family serine peptidase [bacterium]MBP5591991.1 S8 family serine peptidase [bacterium]
MKKILVVFVVLAAFMALSAADAVKPKFTGRIIVKLDSKCLAQGRDKCIKSLGCTEAGELTLKNWALLKCDGEPVTKADALIKKGFKAVPERFVKHQLYSVDSIEPLYLNDVYMKEQWNFHNDGKITAADKKMIVNGKDHAHIAEAWRLLRILGAVKSNCELGKDRKLAIIDDGFDIMHEDIGSGVIASKNFGDSTCEEGNLFSNQTATKNFHGTLVTGIAAARGANGVGPAGACPECSLILARMAGDPEDVGYTFKEEEYKTYYSYYDQIFRWVMEQGAEVVNCSWGWFYGSEDDFLPVKEYFDELFEYAATQANGGKGTLFIFAAGNEGEDFSFNPFATNPNVLAVGATDSTGTRYSFSNYGPKLGVMAPTAGGEYQGSGSSKKFFDRIWTTDNYIAPTCSNPGTSGCHDKAGWNPEHNMAGGDLYVGKYSYRFSHTSSAAPLVSGVAAVVLEANPNLTALELKEILTSTADQVSKSDAGYDANGHSNYYGYGRVNALRAVAAAWIKGGGVITKSLKDAIDKASPCTKDNCWNFAGASYPDEDLYDYDPNAEDECEEQPYTPPDPEDDEVPDDDNADSDSGDTGDSDTGTDTGDTTDTGTDPDTGDTQNDEPAGPLCGNGNIDANEICDGNTMPCANLAGAPKNGTAKCASNCMSWDKSGCYNDGEEPPASDTDEPSADNGNDSSSDSNSEDESDDSGCAIVLID